MGSNRSYLLKDGDVGGSISVRVTVVDKEGNEVEKEADLEGVVMDENDEHTGRVKIDALSIFAGDTITANIESLSDLDGIDATSYSYQWYVEGEAIETATGRTVEILGDWSGKEIYVEVMFNDELGNENISQSVSRGVHGDTAVKILTESFTARENYAGEIGTLSVSDDSITGLEFSVGDERFTIDGDGVLSLALEQDYELSGGILSVALTVENDGVLTIKEVSVNLLDVNDAPDFVLGGEEISVEENSASRVDPIGTISALDQDGNTIEYSVSDEVNFSIDESSGELYLVVEQSRETTQELQVTITAADGQATNSTATKVITVRITDVNDAPEFPVGALSFSIDENTISDASTRFMIPVVDQDGDSLIYSIDDEVNFSIDSVSGGLELSLLVAQDYEVDTSLDLLLTADDGRGEANSVSSKAITVNIRDVNERPVFEEAAYSFAIVENMMGLLGTVSASDDDGDAIVYSVNDDVNFSINSSTGELSLIVGQNFETASNLAVMVTGDDGQGAANSRSVVRVSVDITDENDAPEFTTDSGTFTINENDGRGVLGRALGVIGARDDDGDRIVYSVSDTRNFLINRTGGELHLILAQNHETTPELMVTVTISDGQATNDTATKVLTITISDVNEDPEFDVAPIVYTIVENRVSGMTALGTVTATDEDRNTDILYSVSDSTNFSIDEMSGELYLLVGQDHEAMGQLMLTVTADDQGGGMATKEVGVIISDENDAPEFTTDIGSFTINENAVSGVTALGRIGARDDDDGDTIEYRVSDSDEF